MQKHIKITKRNIEKLLKLNFAYEKNNISNFNLKLSNFKFDFIY